MTKNNSLEAMTKIVEVLTPLASEERTRVVKAAMVMLGEEVPKESKQGGGTGDAGDDTDAGTLTSLSPRARVWMKQNSLGEAELQQVFHIADDGVEVIAAQIPGKGKKEQTYNAYVLTGIGQLLSTGNPLFQDKQARSLCERSGCYDTNNHSYTIKNRGNEFTGTKEKGWTLTAPGLKRGANLIKELNGQSHD